METTPRLPEALRRAVREDLRPVRPLASPARRALAVLAWAPAALAAVVALLPLRPDLPALGWALSWGVLLVEVAAGAGLVALALAATIPGRGPGRERIALTLALALVLFASLAALARRASPGLTVPDPLVTKGATCMTLETVLGFTALAVVFALIVRAAPLRAAGAALLAGAGTGLMAEGIFRLHCPITDLRHVLVWHGGALVVLALSGLALGAVLERRARARMDERLAGRSG